MELREISIFTEEVTIYSVKILPKLPCLAFSHTKEAKPYQEKVFNGKRKHLDIQNMFRPISTERVNSAYFITLGTKRYLL